MKSKIPVSVYDAAGKFLYQCPSQYEAAKKTGVSQATISYRLRIKK